MSYQKTPFAEYEDIRTEEMTLDQLVTGEVEETMHPALKNFRPPDIGVLISEDSPDESPFIFFAHPRMADENRIPHESVGLCFPKGLNDTFDNNAYACDWIGRDDTVIRIPKETYLELNPGANLFIELPF